MKTIPFTYHICWSKENLHYYGVRYAKGCQPSDLWNPYKTSSKIVPLIVEQYGDPDIIKVQKTFDTREQATNWEFRVLKRLGVIKRDDWLNQSIGGPPDNRGRRHSEETRKKISVANSGKNCTKVTRKKMSVSGKGRKFSDAHRNNLSISGKGRKFSDEHKRKLSEALMGRTWQRN